MHATHLRIASPDDAEGLATVHVASWRETYAGILPGEALDSLSVESRAALWTRILTDSASSLDTAVWVVEAAQGIVGFGACGKQRDAGLADKGFSGEISAIYVLRSFQGLGLGRSIMRSLAATLHQRQHEAATLWVLKKNAHARAFYEHLGGVMVDEGEVTGPYATHAQIAYGWHDLTSLASCLRR
jgi:ribosomal protein S18 acetylase RimI-like enzyme